MANNQVSQERRKPVYFPLGHCLITPGAKALLESLNEPPMSFLQRHQSNDWGDVCKEDSEANDHALHDGTRLLSAYLVNDSTIWIITEADRSSTTVLLPEEY